MTADNIPPVPPPLALTRAAGRASLAAATAWVVTGLGAECPVDTPSGPVAAGALRVGMAVVAAAGGTARVARIDHRVIQPDTLRQAPSLRPIGIRAGAFGDGLPAHPVSLAPGQIVIADGAAVPAASLIDGGFVRRMAPSGAVTYVTIALDPPGLLHAAGLACDGIGRAPAPIRTVIALRRAMEQRAGLRPGPVQGTVEHVSAGWIVGWALDPAHPSVPVPIEIRAGEVPVAWALADIRRPDLEMAGLGDGNCAFAVPILPPLAPDRPHLLRICRAGGADLPGSPLLLVPPPARADIAGIVAAAAGDAARDRAAQAIAGLLDTALSASCHRGDSGIL